MRAPLWTTPYTHNGCERIFLFFSIRLYSSGSLFHALYARIYLYTHSRTVVKNRVRPFASACVKQRHISYLSCALASRSLCPAKEKRRVRFSKKKRQKRNNLYSQECLQVTIIQLASCLFFALIFFLKLDGIIRRWTMLLHLRASGKSGEPKWPGPLTT